MNETYSYSNKEGISDHLELTQKEKKVIAGLGLNDEMLQKLITGKHFAEGSYALLFELTNNDSDLVAKVWKNRKRDSARAINETVALRLLKIRGFNISPQIKGYLKSPSILFEEKIDGQPVRDFDKDVIDRLAKALAYLHSIKLEKYGNPLKNRKAGTRMELLNDGIEMLHRLAAHFTGQTETIALINQVLEKMKNESHKSSDAFIENSFTLIHFDLNPDNILYSKNNDALAIIDWEQASAGDNAMDIAKLFLKSNFNLEQKQEFLSQYEKYLVEKDSKLEERLRIYEPFVLINSILWRLRVLRDAPQQASSENETQFYKRVKNNLEHELIGLQNFLNDAKHK